jgi:pimeloyl-ACP methyl ester carboxylesterase
MEPNSQADRTGATIPGGRGYREHVVPRGAHRIYAREYLGQEPAIVLLHGFPDDLHLYDRLVPELAGGWWPSTFWVGRPPTSHAATRRLREFDRPVRIVFGAADPYLKAGVARRFHELFPTSQLFLLDGARHYVQLGQPQQVARLLLAIPKG